MNDKNINKQLNLIKNIQIETINDYLKNVISKINKDNDMNIDYNKYTIKYEKKKEKKKRKSSGYHIFLGDQKTLQKIELFKKKNPNVKNGDIFKEKARIWKEMSKEEKEKYQNLAEYSI